MARTVWGAISQRAERSPDAPAIRTVEQVWSYGAFCDGAERLASGLLALGLSRGDRLLLVGGNSPETCLLWLACQRLGLAACMVSRKATTRELLHAVRMLSPKAIAGERAQLDLARQALVAIAAEHQVSLIPFCREPGAPSVQDLLEVPLTAIAQPHPGDAAEVLFTSGTTSAPKAVVATSGRLLDHWLAVSKHYRLGADDVGYVVTPIHHQSAIRHVALISWLAGAEVFVADGFHPQQVWSDVQRYRVTYTCMLDAMFRILVSLAPSPQETGHALRLVIGVGDHGLAELCERRYGFEVIEVYGSTETGAPVAARLGMDAAEHARYRNAVPGARFCGWPLPGNSLSIKHQDGEPLQAGGFGELIVRSTVASGGYLNGPAYGGGSDEPGDDAVHSSDRGLLGPDGAVYFAGRSQEIIRRAGENISALEIEAVISEHPDVILAAVIGVPDPVRQEEVKAFIVARLDKLDPAALRCWLESQLSPHKLPRYIDLCASLPMTESGKIAKGELGRGDITALSSYDALAPMPEHSPTR